MNQKLQEIIDKTKRNQYIDNDVLSSALPKINGKIEFFKLGKYVSNEELEKEYQLRGLVPADIQTLCEYDIKNQKKMDEMKYVGTQWKNTKGKRCYATFDGSGVGRGVNVDQGDLDWRAYWWFAGVRKSTQKSETKPSSDTLSLELRVQKLEKWARNLPVYQGLDN